MSSNTGTTNGTLTLHHLDHSQSQRILWLCSELSAAYPTTFSYTLVNHFRNSMRQAPDSLKAVSPSGKAPCLVLPNGRRLNESVAIINYLLHAYDVEGRFGGIAQLELDAPHAVSSAEDAPDAIREDELVSHASTTLGSIVQMCFVLQIIPPMSPWVLRPVLRLMFGGMVAGLRPFVGEAMRWWEERLQGREYVSGNAGGREAGRADFVVEFPMSMCFERGILNENDFPNVKAYRQRCMARPAWKEALNKGNGYDWKSYGF